MTDCVFCKIIKKEIPSNIIYENDKVIVFLDINPVNDGHTLIVPKEHYENLLDAPKEILEELILATQKIAKAVTKALNYSGFNLGVNNGQVAGQIIPHLHFHIIPRKEGDNLKPWPGRKTNQKDLEKIAQKIREEIREEVK